ncbi:MAG: aminopeptidase N [Thiotrichales bacterium]
MKDSTPRAIFLKDYQASSYLIDTTELWFDLQDGHTVVTARLTLRRNPLCEARPPELRLDGEQLELLTISLDAQPLAAERYRLDECGLTLLDPPDALVLETTVRIHPERNTALEGLYQSSGNYCTQCEAEGFRRITFYLDRPDVMAVFTTTIEAERARFPILLSNGNPVASGDADGARHWVKWNDPFPKPAYLFALVAGNLALTEDHFVTASGREIALRIYTEPHNADKTAHAMRSLHKAMRWDEQRFGLEYDLDLFMIVAVDDFNMGAMENKGLNVFNSKLLLARPDTATDADYEAIEAVIAHEYFHNWTGNRVTCRDWFQLSLKEGLTVFRDQEFTADMSSPAVKRIDDVRKLRTFQFAEDASPMAHPVRPASYMEINNFYTMTVYDKGAEVVRMYQTLLGRDGFRKGMDLYFLRHDGQAVTTDDFRAAMADANVVDLDQFQRWYDQAGTPELEIADGWEAHQGHYTLSVSQTCPPTGENRHKQPFLIPLTVSLLDRTGQALPLQRMDEPAVGATERVLQLTEATQHFTFVGLSERPVPSLLRHYSAPVKLRYDYQIEQLAFLMAHDTDAFNRWEAGQRLATRMLLDAVAQVQTGATIAEHPELQAAFETLLRRPVDDPALLAEALVLPDEGYLAEQLPVIDVDAIHSAREALRRNLARQLLPLWRGAYAAHETPGDYRYQALDAGKRRLKNVALAYWVISGEVEARRVALAQFTAAANMTDGMGALRALNQLDCTERDQALRAFHDQWQDDPLVLDKWFMLEAGAALPATLDRVRALLDHPRYSSRKPNRVRALIGAFTQNTSSFHRADGAGYGLVAEQILVLDPINPQIAARLVKSFSRWRRYDAARQASMRAHLERIRNTASLSRDVFEIVDRSLA